MVLKSFAEHCVYCYWTYLTSCILLEIDESTIICMIFWTNKLNYAFQHRHASSWRMYGAAKNTEHTM